MKTSGNAHPSGAISLGCLGYIIAVGLLWGGGQGIYTALRNHKPAEFTVADFIATKPDVEWITLKDARLSLLEAAHKELAGKVTEVFIPVRPKDGNADQPVHILLSTKEPEMTGAVENLKNSSGSKEEAVKAVARHAEKLVMLRDVSGLVRFGLDADSKTRDKLAKLHLKLTDDFVILDEGKKPDIYAGSLMFGAGLVVGFFMLRKAGKQSSPPAPAPVPPNLPPKS